jgi:hypothetical protein
MSDTRRFVPSVPSVSPVERMSSYLDHTKLQMPSERRREFETLKNQLKSQADFKEQNRFYTKQRILLEQKHDNIIGIENPFHVVTEHLPSTGLYKARVHQLQTIHNRKDSSDHNRLHFLSARKNSHIFEGGLPAPPSNRKIGNERYLNTHSRLWPETEKSKWTPERALEIYKHDIRDREYNIINFGVTTIDNLKVRDD